MKITGLSLLLALVVVTTNAQITQFPVTSGNRVCPSLTGKYTNYMYKYFTKAGCGTDPTTEHLYSWRFRWRCQ